MRGFERPALEGVVRWKFRPGMKLGRKVNTRVIQPIDFSINDGK
jgi:protein TonB